MGQVPREVAMQDGGHLLIVVLLVVYIFVVGLAAVALFARIGE